VNERHGPRRRDFLTLFPDTIRIKTATETAKYSLPPARTDDEQNGSGLVDRGRRKEASVTVVKQLDFLANVAGLTPASSCHPLFSLHLLASESLAKPAAIYGIGGHTVAGQTCTSRVIAAVC
jgi:hypothetical protein